jgi:hypothetical protein
METEKRDSASTRQRRDFAPPIARGVSMPETAVVVRSMPPVVSFGRPQFTVASAAQPRLNSYPTPADMPGPTAEFVCDSTIVTQAEVPTDIST